LVVAASGGRAEVIFYAQWGGSTADADPPGRSYVGISGLMIPAVIGGEPWRRVAYGTPSGFETSLYGENLPPDSAPDHYTARPWQLNVLIFEHSNVSYPHGEVTFTGVFDGTLSLHDLSLTSTFTSAVVQTTQINGRTWTVRLDPPAFFTAPQPRDRGYYFGSISGTITVEPAPLPEPSSFLLIAFSPLAALLWRRHRAATERQED
jgi:hypothetical protein